MINLDVHPIMYKISGMHIAVCNYIFPHIIDSYGAHSTEQADIFQKML